MMPESTRRLLDSKREEFERTGVSHVRVRAIKTKAIPYDNWPLWAKALRHVSQPEDKGIGDVIARTIGPENSEAFKAWYKKTTGKDCGCTGRQAKWNLIYPLKPV